MLGRPAIYPWRTMKVGDSFQLRPGLSLASAKSMCNIAARRTGRCFAVEAGKTRMTVTRVYK